MPLGTAGAAHDKYINVDETALAVNLVGVSGTVKINNDKILPHKLYLTMFICSDTYFI